MAKKHWFGTAPRAAGIAALALTFCLALAGCDTTWSPETDGYIFRFKADNYTTKTINKIEFINGDTKNDNVVGSISQQIAPDARSSETRVRGFTIEHGSSTRIFGVKVTFEDATTVFNYSYAGHENKILVKVNYSYSGGYYPPISFSSGNW